MNKKSFNRRSLPALLAVPVLAGTIGFAAQNNSDECVTTAVKPYAVAYSPEYVVKPLFSVGDVVPVTGDASRSYQMVGIPDGLGVTKLANGKVAVYMNHEFGNTVLSKPYVNGPTYKGTFVSLFTLNQDGCVESGELAYDAIYDHEKNVVLPPATTANTTPAFARFCGGTLAYQDAGFDRPIYFTGEESGGTATFDGKGGLTVAIFDKELHTLPWMGRFPWENTVPRTAAGQTTVLMMNEDGPSSPDSQLYMWAGQKDRSAKGGLDRNGLGRDQGKFLVLAPVNPANINEVTVTNGSIPVKWVEIEGVEAMTDVQLEAATDAAGGFGFIRVEDGNFDKQNPDIYYFVTTGGATGNQLGRLYRLDLNPKDPTGNGTLTVIYNADQIIAAGGDIAVSPDNIETTKDSVLICEDGTAQSRVVMAAKGRDGQIWKFDIKNNYAATPIVELNPPGTYFNAAVTNRPPVVGPGVWETTGIVETEGLLGNGTFLFNVQAHPPTLAPAPFTVEDGQLMLLKRINGKKED